jgi:hypothetical protein
MVSSPILYFGGLFLLDIELTFCQDTLDMIFAHNDNIYRDAFFSILSFYKLQLPDAQNNTVYCSATFLSYDFDNNENAFDGCSLYDFGNILYRRNAYKRPFSLGLHKEETCQN